MSEEKDILQGVSDRYDCVARVLGTETVDTAVQQDIQNEKVIEEKRRMEQMLKGSIYERLAWGMKKGDKIDKIVHLHFCIYWNSTLENTMVK